MRNLLLVLVLGIAASAQENLRDIERTGGHTKHLTANLEDSWRFTGQAGETLLVHVTSDEFDPVIRLEGPEGVVVEPVDDPGSESRFMARLARQGKYEIKVHAFRHAGGGNYRLHLDRFQAERLDQKAMAAVTFARDGRAHLRFSAQSGQLTAPRFEGLAPGFEILDPKGRAITLWEGAAAVESDGEHVLSLRGTPETRCTVGMTEAVLRELGAGTPTPATMGPQGLDVWRLEGQAGELRTIEMTTTSPLASRFVFASPRTAEDETLLDYEEPPFRLLPAVSKGQRIRYAVVFNRSGRFELQIRSHVHAAVAYDAALRDPSRPLTAGQPASSMLSIGETHFWRLRMRPGTVFEVRMESPDFDPFLRLVGPKGALVQENDDGGGGLAARFRRLVRADGDHWLQVSCSGDGGGGSYELQAAFPPIPEIAIDERHEIQLGPDDGAVLRFSGRSGRVVFVSARSTTVDTKIELLSPSGVSLGTDDDNGVDTDALLAARLPTEGTYTVIVTGSRGAGRCVVRIIDGD